MTGPDASRSVALDFAVTDVALRSPGTCLASDGACGHVVVTVDGEACNAIDEVFNSVAIAPPARAALAQCPGPVGSHTITLSLAHDDRSPWLVEEAPVAASVSVVAELPPLLARFGGEDGMQALAAEMIERQLGTSTISAHFRNASVNHDAMEICLAEMFEKVADPEGASGDTDCELDMAAAHAGLGISQVDMDDWLQQFAGATASLGITETDAAEFTELLAVSASGIVEDPDNNATLYQRLGRRPGISAIVQSFAMILSMNAQLSRYFLNDEGLPEYSEIFAVCLTRMLGSLDGPFIYGEEFPLEPALEEAGRNCRGMVDSHAGLTSAPPTSAPIGPDEFLEVALVLVASLEYHEVPSEDIDLLVQAMNLPDLCERIVVAPPECAALFPPEAR